MPDTVAQESHGSDASMHMLDDLMDRESKKPRRSSWLSHLLPSGCNLALPVNRSSAVYGESSSENVVKQEWEPVQIAEARKLSMLAVDIDSDRGMADVTSSTLHSAAGVLAETSRIKIANEGSGMLKWSMKNINPTLEAKAASLGSTLSKPFPMLDSKSFVDPKTDPAMSNSHSPKPQMNSKYGIDVDVAPVGMKEPPVPLPMQMPKKSGISSQVADLPGQWMKHYKSLGKKAVSSTTSFQDGFKGSTSCSLMYGMPDGSKYHHHNLLQRMPTCSVNDVETFGLSRTVDSVEGVPRGSSTHHLFFAKKVNLNLSKGNQEIVDTVHGEEFDENAFLGPVCKQELMSQSLSKSARTGFLCEEFHNVHCWSRDGMGEGSSSSQPFYPPYSQCAGNEINSDASGSKGHFRKFPLPVISRKHIEIKQKEDVGCHAVKTGEDTSTLKSGENESSTETAHKDAILHPSRNFAKDFGGVAPSSVQKDAKVSQEPAKSQAMAISRSKEDRSGDTTQIADKNKELLTSSDIDNIESSTSRTESLDAEHLLLHVDQSESSNSGFQQNCLSRWVKRLRSNSLDARGTKSSNMEDISSEEKGKMISRILGDRRADSEPAFSASLGKTHRQLEKSMSILRHHREASSVNLQKGHRDAALSHSWIQRWCRVRRAGPWAGPARVIFEPDDSKVALEGFHEKQYPSIAGMALLGKAVSNIRPCEFRRSGSLVVWNAEGV